MPSASHGTLRIAPSRKNTRKVPSSHPVATPVASAALASANRARANVQAPWCGLRVCGPAHGGGLREHGRDGGGDEGETGDHELSDRSGAPDFGKTLARTATLESTYGHDSSGR